MAFQGSLAELPLPDIIQLVSVSGKTGVFTIDNAGETGQIYLKDGRIAHALVGDLSGEEAVYELAIWPRGEFVFDQGTEPPEISIQKSNTNLLMEAARRIDEWQVLSKRIPSTRLVPVFTNQGTSASVSFTPGEWAVIRKIDERRSIEEVSLGLQASAFETCKILYGLITSGLVELKEDLANWGLQRLQLMTPADLDRLARRIHQHARQMLTGHARIGELDGAFRMTQAELHAGRGVDAVLDLVRAEEQLISAALGPNQARAFLGKAREMLEGA